jgi:small subunit ribosomal protein S2
MLTRPAHNALKALFLRRGFASYGHLRDAPADKTAVMEEASTEDAYDIDDILASFDEAQAGHTMSRESGPSLYSEAQLKMRRARMNKVYAHFGSKVDTAYSPRQQLYNPPEVEQVTVSSLLAAQAHMGHSTTLWEPLTQPFIFGVREGIHIFNLNLTLAHLRRAAAVVRGVAQADGNILFVGTRPGQKRSVIQAAERAGGYHIFSRWVPGTITNGKQVVGHGVIKGTVTRHVKNKFPGKNPDSAPDAVVPDLVVVLNPLENRVLLKECAKGRVPTVGIIDSDCDPRWVTYSIPANDDSLRCTSLVAGVLSLAAAAGRRQMNMPDWVQEETSLSQAAVS